jgi:RNA recognition motif-containing protein
MSTKLFVGSLSWNTTSSELQNAFAACGDVVEAKVITDRDTGRSRGFGFVTYNDSDAATRAIEELDGSMLDGRTIRVDRANDRPQRDRGSTARW